MSLRDCALRWTWRDCRNRQLPSSLCQNLSIPFLLGVDITGDQTDLSRPDCPEKNATLTLWRGSVPQRYLHGIITGVETQKSLLVGKEYDASVGENVSFTVQKAPETGTVMPLQNQSIKIC